MTDEIICAFIVITALAGAAAQEGAQQPNPVVVFETEKGAIEMEVDSVRAPITAANFLKYVDGGFFSGGMVNRAVRSDNTMRRDVEIQVIQFQMNPARRKERFPAIPLERTSVTGLTHLDGTLSMARSTPDSATASFSIVIGDQPEMNFGGQRNPDGQGFAAFGRHPGNGRRQGDPVVADRPTRRLRHRDARPANQSPQGTPALAANTLVPGASPPRP